MAKKVEKVKKIERYNWQACASSYLTLAKIGCRDLKEGKYKSGIGFDDLDYEQKTLLIPILFNIKHAIEVFIKSINIQVDGEYEKDHNLEKLFNKLKSTLPVKIKIKDNKMKISESLDNLKSLIQKYFQCEVIKDLLNNSNIVIKDEENTLFRYPEDRVAIKIGFLSIFKNFGNDKIEEILEDVKKINANFLIINSRINQDQNDLCPRDLDYFDLIKEGHLKE